MKTTPWNALSIAMLACSLGLASCGGSGSEDGTRINVSTSESGGTDTVVQQNTVVEQRTDTVLQQRVDTVVKREVDTVVRRDTVTQPRRPAVTSAEKAQIDAWLGAHADSLNQYGDPKSMVYAGGTPLFNEATGARMDRYDYIVMKNPSKPWAMTTPAQPRR